MLASTLTLPEVNADRNETRPSTRSTRSSEPTRRVMSARPLGGVSLGWEDAPVLDHREPGGVEVGDVAAQHLAGRDGRAHVGLVAVQARHQHPELPLDLGLGRHSHLPAARFRLTGFYHTGSEPTRFVDRFWGR